MGVTILKVLMVLMCFDIGGVETHVLELSKSLKEYGLEVFVASNGGTYVNELEKNDIMHYKVPLNTKRLISLFRSYIGLKKIIKEKKIDVVHAHARIPAFVCWFLNKREKFAFVTTVHGLFKLGLISKIMTRWGQKSLVVSEDLKVYLNKNYNVENKNIKITVNGINAKYFFEEKKLHNLEDKRANNILHVSRLTSCTSLVANKLIENAPEIYKKIENLKIIIVGSGDEFANLQRKAEKFNLKHRKEIINLVGSKTNVFDYIKKANIFVGVSRAALEAMASGIPVILAGNQGYLGILDKTKFKSAILTNFCCRNFKTIENKVFVEDICKINNMNAYEIEKIGKFNKQIIKKYYSIQKMRDDALEVYSSVIQENRKKISKNERRNDVLISGYYGHKNSGDETILKSIIDDLREIKPDIKVAVLSKNPKETSKDCEVESINKFSFLKISKILGKTKLLINGGGCILQDQTSTRSLLYYLGIIKLAHIKKTKIMIYANGIGPINSKINKKITKNILNICDIITVREPYSLFKIKDLGVNKPDILLTADPVFSIKPKQNSNKDILQRLEVNCKYAAISIRNLKYKNKDFVHTILKFCKYIKNDHGITPFFIPMQNQDYGISMRLLKEMQLKQKFININLKTFEIMEIIKNSKFVLSMRLHSLMFAYMFGKCSIGINYGGKIKSFMDYTNQAFCLDLGNINFEKLKEYVDVILKDKDGEVKYLPNIKDLVLKSKLNAKIAIKLIKNF